jgi:hypothetical protein
MFFLLYFPQSWILPFPVTGIVVRLLDTTNSTARNDLYNLLIVFVVHGFTCCIENGFASNLGYLLLYIENEVVILLVIDTLQVLIEVGSCLKELSIATTCL